MTHSLTPAEQHAAIRKYLRRTVVHVALSVCSFIVARATHYAPNAQRAGIVVLAWHLRQTFTNCWKMIAIARIRC